MEIKQLDGLIDGGDRHAENLLSATAGEMWQISAETFKEASEAAPPPKWEGLGFLVSLENEVDAYYFKYGGRAFCAAVSHDPESLRLVHNEVFLGRI